MHEYTSTNRVWGLTCPGFPEEISRVPGGRAVDKVTDLVHQDVHHDAGQLAGRCAG